MLKSCGRNLIQTAAFLEKPLSQTENVFHPSVRRVQHVVYNIWRDHCFPLRNIGRKKDILSGMFSKSSPFALNSHRFVSIFKNNLDDFVCIVMKIGLHTHWQHGPIVGLLSFDGKHTFSTFV